MTLPHPPHHEPHGWIINHEWECTPQEWGNMTMGICKELANGGGVKIKGAAIRQIIMESGPLKSKAYAVKVADRLHNLLTLGSLKDKPSASAEERAATTIKSTELVLPLARDVDMAYRGMGSGLLTYPYMCYLVGQLRFNRPS